MTWLLLLLACGGEITTDETGATETADTQETEVDCEGVLLNGMLVELDGLTLPEEPLSMALIAVDLGEGLELDGIYAQWEVGVLGDGDAFSICLPETVDELEEVDDGVSIAAFMVGAWGDDGDGEPDEGDVFVGASLELLTYIEGSSEDVEELGGEPGWNLMTLEIEAGPTELVPFADGDDGFVLESNLLPADPGTLSAVVRPAVGGPVLADLHSLLDLGGSGGPDAPAIASVEYTSDGRDGTLSWEVPAMPPEDHFDDELGENELPDALIASYVGVVYDDDGDGGFAFGDDELLAYSTGGESARFVAYIQATGFAAVYFGEVVGHTGWMLLAGGEDEGVVDWEEGLVLDEDGD